MNIQLLIIDPQMDFCDPSGSLFVPGADDDSKRLAEMINRLSKKIDDIHVTLDSHNLIDVAHPIFWINSAGQHPDPFTIISEDDVKNGVWTTTNPGWRARGLKYVQALSANNRYPLCIWPPHCLIGSLGHSIKTEVSDALIQWSDENFGRVDFVTKGSNMFTEHYSAVRADVEDDQDPTTALNTDLIEILADADEIPISGQALSHCVAFTVTDIADNFGAENIKKFTLLEDTCSNVTGFEQNGINFVANMRNRGMKVAKSTDYFV